MTEIPIPNEGEPQKETLMFPDELRHNVKSDTERVLKAPRWRRLQGDELAREDEELRRTSIEMQLDYDNLVRAFQNAQLVELSDADWDAMENVGWSGDITPSDVAEIIGSTRDYKRIFMGIETGECLPAPIVMFRDGHPPYLIAGNTRLMACKALNIRPMILAMHI